MDETENYFALVAMAGELGSLKADAPDFRLGWE